MQIFRTLQQNPEIQLLFQFQKHCITTLRLVIIVSEK